MNENFIDAIAALRKFGIESSGYTRDEKEWAKSGVDCISSALKSMLSQPKQNITVMGLNIEQIRAIKNMAAQYNVTKVALFPCLDNQNIVPLIRVYGEDREKFFHRLGLTPVNPNTYSNYASEYDVLEKEYGVILYENL